MLDLQRNSAVAVMTLDPIGCTPRADGGAALRVLIDPSGYRCRNIGDTAMLQVALTRLRSYWPQAAIQIHSLDSESVRVLEPRSRLCRAIRHQRPAVMKSLGAAALFAGRRSPRVVSDFLGAVRRANLVLMSGAGSLNDCFKRDALCRLETLELAMECGAVTALVGQGIGPMSNPVLRGLAARILPKVDFIALRDGVDSLTFLNDIGVAASRVNITADDAVGLAYRSRMESSGTVMGVNLRVASHSGLDSAQAVAKAVEIGAVVRATAERIGAAMWSLPVSSYDEEDELQAAQLILQEALEDDAGRAFTPPDFLVNLPQCRIVVAESYHAVVFALSMGIPAVGIAGCDYYVHKFRGLADQFGPACRVELISHPDFHRRLEASIEAAWQSAPTARQALLRSAVRQVARGKNAYRRLFTLVENRALQ